MISPPAARPCGSCPYRRDVPSGVWHPDEYLKLPAYDRPTPDQPPAAFLCHRHDGRLCAGWVAVHDMDHSLGLRLAVSLGGLTPEDYTAVLGYTTTVELFASGEEAALHGLKDIAKPGTKARSIMRRIGRKQI